MLSCKVFGKLLVATQAGGVSVFLHLEIIHQNLHNIFATFKV